MTTEYTLITGASEGIGKEIARSAARDGRSIILTARSEDKLNALAEELRSDHGVEVVVIPADLSSLEESERLWTEAVKDRRINTLVNNAGLGRNGAFADGGWERELLSIQVNLLTLTDLMKRAVAHMNETGKGRILNVSSVAGFVPGPGMAVYHASKAYVLYLSEAVAEELSNTDITVTTLCPGATQTGFFDEADMHDVRLVKSGMVAKAKDVAEAGWMAMRVGKRVMVPGFMNKVTALLPRFVPRWVATWISKQVMSRQ